MNLNIKQRLRNWRTPKDRDKLGLSLEHGGHRFYTFSEGVAVPNVRLENVFARMEQVSLGITKPHLKSFIKTMKDAGKTADIGQVMMLTDYFETVIEQPINLSPMLYLSTPLVLIDDEPVLNAPDKYEKKKLELQLQDDTIRGFFLQCSINILQEYQKDWTSTGVWEDLMNPKSISVLTENSFLRAIGIRNY